MEFQGLLNPEPYAFTGGIRARIGDRLALHFEGLNGWMDGSFTHFHTARSGDAIRVSSQREPSAPGSGPYPPIHIPVTLHLHYIWQVNRGRAWHDERSGVGKMKRWGMAL